MAATANFVKLCTMCVNLDDVSSCPCEPTPDAAGVPTLNVKMRGAHNTLTLTDPDDQAAMLEAIGEKEGDNEFLKQHAEAKKLKAKAEAEKAKTEAAVHKAEKPAHETTHKEAHAKH